MIQKLIELDNNDQFVIKYELLQIEVFNNLWKRDKSPGKEKVLKELALIWFLVTESRHNSYFIEHINKNENERIKIIAEDLGLGKYKPDKLILDAIEWSKSRNYNEVSETLKSLKLTKRSLKTWFDTYDPDEPGAAVELDRNLKSLVNLDKTIMEYEKKVTDDSDSDSRIRGNSDIGGFEEDD